MVQVVAALSSDSTQQIDADVDPIPSACNSWIHMYTVFIYSRFRGLSAFGYLVLWLVLDLASSRTSQKVSNVESVLVVDYEIGLGRSWI